MEDRPEVVHNEVQVVLTLAVTTLNYNRKASGARLVIRNQPAYHGEDRIQ